MTLKTPLMRLAAYTSLALIVLSACASQPDYRESETEPPTVASVDLSRYVGKWYEIARYPNSFETDCVGVTAEYIQKPDGEITVINTCRKESLSAEPQQARGFAKVVEGSNTAKLKVQFAPRFVPFAAGDYWILHLEPDYSAALVGDPSGKYLWILARTSALDTATLERIKTRAEALGYQSAQLVMTLQADEEA